MTQYPYRHSTYFTGRDPHWTSELPPMNSTEDILQEMFMRDRNTVYNVTTVSNSRLQGVKKLFRYIKDWRRDASESSFLSMPRSVQLRGGYRY